MGLTNEIALKEVQKLYDMCFDANALCDRISYVYSLRFNMIDFGDWVHHNIAHFFSGSKMADSIQAFGDLRGDLFYRGNIPIHNEDYRKPSDAMNSLVLAVASIENQCVKALKVCANEGSESFEDFLRTLNVDVIVPLLKQTTVFYNFIKAYEDSADVHKINKDFNAWIIPYFKNREGS